MNIKALRQAKADNDSAQATLKAEGRKLMAVAADKRTPEQVARLDAIDTELTALSEQAVTIAADLARAERYADAERAQGTAPDVQMGVDHATERPWGPPIPANATAGTRERMLQAELGAFLVAVANDTRGIERDPRLYAAASGATTANPQDGGHLVRQEWSTMLLEKAEERSVLANRCTSIPIGDGFDAVELPYIEETSRATGSRWGGVRVYRRDEADTVTASKPKIEKQEIRVEDLMALYYATDRILRDATAMGTIASKAFVSEFAFKVDDEIVRGTGVGQCKGLLNALTSGTPAGAVISVAKVTGQAADSFVHQNIIDMWVRLHPRHRANAAWFINSELEPQIDTLLQAAGTSAVEPRFVTYGPDGVLRMKNRPVIVVEQCSAPGDVGDVILADLSEYLLATKGGLESASSMHVRFLYDEMTFRWTRKISGQPAWRSALTPYKGSLTTSPYVTLAARA